MSELNSARSRSWSWMSTEALLPLTEEALIAQNLGRIRA
jgi:hypothetical protein